MIGLEKALKQSSLLTAIRLFICFLVLGIAIPASGIIFNRFQQTATSEEEMVRLAKNFEYRLSDGSRYSLKDGEHEAGESLEDYVRLRLADLAIGDLNGDGQSDVAVVLVSSFGGSGHFYELTALINEGHSFRQINNLELGDRVNIESLEIENRRINITLLTHGPHDPMCCPSQKKELVAYLKGGKLVML